MLYVRSRLLKTSIKSLAHHFLKVDDIAYKLQPGGPGYELVYGTTGVITYLQSLAPDGTLKTAFELIAKHEQELIKPLLSYLTDPAQEARGVRIVGEEKPGPSRVPTISFVVVGPKAIKSKDVIDVFDKKGGVRVSTIILKRFSNLTMPLT